ncbi:MAG: hypothetical protein K5874_01590 [Bacteroidaceae bacterium]|nr:hypothetical protein [Bacteroidaceae bacterium]
MTIYKYIYIQIVLIAMLMLSCLTANAQKSKTEVRIPKAQLHRNQAHTTLLDTISQKSNSQQTHTIKSEADSVISIIKNDSVQGVPLIDTLKVVNQLTNSVIESTPSTIPSSSKIFVPDPQKALWLAIVFPGGGQIYNRKYWKLPLIYGGFVGCAYAINWNNTMYQDYSQAYIDIMDDDPNTKSYEDFIPKNFDVNSNMQRIQDLFKRKKNYYRRYRDLSVFCMIGVYALSIIDAYVDAELSTFDINKDLSMKVRPSVINNKSLAIQNPYPTQSYGIQCSLHF